MFEHRLGLALGKTISEIRAMPYAEFRAWQLFNIIEPFGWNENEYHTAAILAMLYNANRGKGKAKTVKDFVRDIESSVMDELKDGKPIEQMKRADLISAIKKDFGIK